MHNTSLGFQFWIWLCVITDGPGRNPPSFTIRTSIMYSESGELEAPPDARSPLLPRKRISPPSEPAQSNLVDGTSQVYLDGSQQIGPETAGGKKLHYLLYISHFLSTWNSRLFEFGAILFVTSIYTGTLLPTSAYALIRTAAAILFSPSIGKYIDSGNRLRVVRQSIVMQRCAVAVSCIGFWILMKGILDTPGLKVTILGILTFLACIEKLGSVMNTVAVERDWVLVVAESTTLELKVLNSQMRRIDLFCKLMGPLAIALVNGISTQLAIMACLALSVMSVGIEYWAIARVYYNVSSLQINPRMSNSARINPAGAEQTTLGSLSFYYHHPAFAASFSLSILYFTVLSFAGQMVAYLLTVGYDSPRIGTVRTLSVLFEMSATWIAPKVMARIGPLRAAMWFINWQIICLLIGTSLFWHASQPLVGASFLICAVVASRIGLWGFDLSVQIIIQEEVESNYRGTFSSVEASFQNIFELGSYIMTMIFARPEQFRYPVLMSSVAVLVAGILYACFLRKRRGHLLHMPSCMKERSSMSA
ncbi:hypothetical protein H2248_005419 [Termitomyces sp. 'cryptogamus']|nr:hypothetical protein H2248_005419 [Termitomyces sp. 'cryptogamus']